ncbi:hypothetical protein CALVIDRAFT_479838 [Calocera viscosa TUFC12733]|uniref:RING-type domain-containing protein n=1 Tax=Calocera viscosa (strain TUFC12733) TaxID=1330018 RepID=A0A167NA80_CALVF|nr:hypothetical protein CALVIDRAFT_479838 [Calocera viscosa TUFC12733]
MLLRQLHPTYSQNTAHAVIQYLFDHEYPKVERDRGKRKRDDDDEQEEAVVRKKAKLDYESIDRSYPSGAAYSVLAEEQLFEDFPLVPRAHVRSVMEQCAYLYAPTHLRLLQEIKSEALPYTLKARPTPAKTKGKGKASFDADFEAERDWLVLKLAEDKLRADEELAEKLNEQEYEANGEGLECGCCFGDYPFDKMVQCAEGHLFCRNCARRQADERIGLRQTELLCMDQSDCKAPFPESEIARFLPEKTLSLYHRIKQGKEIEKAGLEGLESCPFCDYACVIENDEEKLFRCENEDCLIISCRTCKKQDHLPKSCKEMEQDMRLNARHAVEEAMTNALMRKCPKCHHPFVKEGGCNKMMCNQCQTMSCYICRQVINGYDHFNQARAPLLALDPNKCPLWDTNLDKFHAEEVRSLARSVGSFVEIRAGCGCRAEGTTRDSFWRKGRRRAHSRERFGG